MLRKLGAFTLTELMIVLVIVGILAAMAYPSYINQVRKGRRADAQAALRRILEAYQIENDYGRTLEVYTGQLSEDKNDRVVNFLRVGRNLLFYKSQNGNEIARWDNKLKSWVTMDKKFHREIKKAYLIAKNQRAPELLLLPMSAPEQRVETEK